VELADVGGNDMLLEPSAGRGAIVSAWKGIAFVHAIELLPENVAALQALGWLDSVTKADFLTVAPAPIYDRVVMNPPFARQADIHHVLHALKFLKPDGLLVSVMSAGVSFRDNKLTQDFRDLIRARGGEIEALPEGAFKESGTSVRTLIVTIPSEAA
jgi:predicted RNA methylase